MAFAGAHRGERTDVNQANRTPVEGTRQSLGGPRVSLIVIARVEGLGNAGKMDDGVHSSKRVQEPLAADEIACSGLNAVWKARGNTARSRKDTGGLSDRRGFL